MTTQLQSVTPASTAPRRTWLSVSTQGGFLTKSPEGEYAFCASEEEVYDLVHGHERKRAKSAGASRVEVEWRRTDELVVR